MVTPSVPAPVLLAAAAEESTVLTPALAAAPEPEPIRLTLHVFLPPSFVRPSLLESAARGGGT